MEPVPKLVLAYSGGLDTTTAIKWLSLERGWEVVALNIDVGKSREQPVIESRGVAAGAVSVRVIDARDDFLRYFAFPALAAGAIYQDAYPLATALARPLMAKLLVDVAHEEGATAVAHGCTGKGNDQVRFDVGVQTLDPGLEIVAPTREYAMARETQIEYLKEHGIDIPWGQKGPYSIDENMWGRSAEAGVLGALVGVVGSLQALEAIKEIVGVGTGLVGRLLLFDADAQQIVNYFAFLNNGIGATRSNWLCRARP